MANADTCSRCHTPLPTDPPQEGRRYQLRLKTKTTEHTLKFSIWRFRWMPKDPADEVRTTYTDFPLCDPCSAEVVDFAYGRYPRDAAGELARHDQTHDHYQGDT